MPSSRTLQCPSCGFQIHAEDMNLETLAARCRVCHAFVDLRPAREAEEAEDAPPRPRRDSLDGAVVTAEGTLAPAPPLPVPLPDGIFVSAAGGELRIERRWFTWVAFFLVFFCVIWFGFLALWYAMAFSLGDTVMLLFPLVHVGAGVFVAYTAAAMFVNRTEIVVSRGELAVRHGPLPWPGTRRIPTPALEQLYCEEHVQRTRNGTTVTYSVRARGTNGRLVKLLSGLPDRDQALYIEQEIERFLEIPDRPVASQMRR